jgi:hypothetical protein
MASLESLKLDDLNKTMNRVISVLERIYKEQKKQSDYIEQIKQSEQKDQKEIISDKFTLHDINEAIEHIDEVVCRDINDKCKKEHNQLKDMLTVLKENMKGK